MKNKKKTNTTNSTDYEFCKICKINHNKGRRHNFFPRHTNSLSSLFTRFTNKLSRVKIALKNPNFQISSQSSPDRIWCIFCDSDIVESNSDFVWGGAVEHLASEDHLKNLKHFLWKYGSGGGGCGGDKVDAFRISEDEFAKWKKRCEALKKEAPSSSEIYRASAYGQSNDIQTNSKIINNFNSNKTYFFESCSSKDVLPLQYDTNENYQVYHSDISQDGKSGSFLRNIASNVHVAPEHGLETSSLTCQSKQQPLISSLTSILADGFVNTGGFQRSIDGMELINEGYQSLTRIHTGGSVDMKGNVHSGALPPWLEGFEAFNEHEQSRKPRVNGAQTTTRKTNKLNPKRVGAAWAEKRKLEMEMEKAGESFANVSGVDWLPNFGRVWQSGSRKESMKEFKKEKSNLPKAESQVESEIKFQPYVSKRMRQDTNGNRNVHNTGDIS